MAYIDRDKLIKAVEDLPNCYNGFSDTYDKAFIIGLIEEIPTADVVDKERYDRLLENATIISEALRKYQNADVSERNVGKWIENTEYFPTTYTCPFCGYKIYRETTDFCPSCGADLREE